jgi:hypothetical protein
MRHVVLDGVPKRCLSEEDHAVQAFGFYRAYESLCESIQIGRDDLAGWGQAPRAQRMPAKAH